ncbi:MAG: TRAP transporter small permease [Lachnospiraceae bacterium]|nr:TRAP transporter small permease [Lachnospiraceae bacterium]
MKGFLTSLDKLKPLYDAVYKVVLFICKIFLIGDILITCMAVLGRFVPFIPDPAWTEEVVLTLMTYMAVLSAALAIRKGSHIRMTSFDNYLPKKLLNVLDLVADIAVLALGVVMMIVGWKYANTIGAKGTYVSMPSVSKFWMYFPVPLAGFAMIIFELEAIYRQINKMVGNPPKEDEKKEEEKK